MSSIFLRKVVLRFDYSLKSQIFTATSTIATNYVVISLKLCLRRKYRIFSPKSTAAVIRPFPSSPGPLFQNEGKCSAFDRHGNHFSFSSK